MKKSVQFTFRKASVDQFRDTLMDIRTRGSTYIRRPSPKSNPTSFSLTRYFAYFQSIVYSMIIDVKNENLPHFLTAVGFLSALARLPIVLKPTIYRCLPSRKLRHLLFMISLTLFFIFAFESKISMISFFI